MPSRAGRREWIGLAVLALPNAAAYSGHERTIGSGTEQHAVSVDHGHLRVLDCRFSGYDGDARRSDRQTQVIGGGFCWSSFGTK